MEEVRPHGSHPQQVSRARHKRGKSPHPPDLPGKRTSPDDWATYNIEDPNCTTSATRTDAGLVESEVDSNDWRTTVVAQKTSSELADSANSEHASVASEAPSEHSVMENAHSETVVQLSEENLSDLVTQLALQETSPDLSPPTQVNRVVQNIEPWTTQWGSRFTRDEAWMLQSKTRPDKLAAFLEKAERVRQGFDAVPDADASEEWLWTGRYSKRVRNPRENQSGRTVIPARNIAAAALGVSRDTLKMGDGATKQDLKPFLQEECEAFPVNPGERRTKRRPDQIPVSQKFCFDYNNKGRCFTAGCRMIHACNYCRCGPHIREGVGCQNLGPCCSYRKIGGGRGWKCPGACVGHTSKLASAPDQVYFVNPPWLEPEDLGL